MSPVQKLFDAAGDLDPEEWPAFLERATDDPALRRQVLELLTSARNAGDFLRCPTLDAAGQPVDDAISIRLGAGHQVGPYRIISRLGSGGSGVVFLASQRSPLVREVALKVLRTFLDEEEPRWRFDVEKQAISRLDHPGIARVLDAGLIDGDRPWLAMEVVRGEPVDAWCDHHSLSLAERALLMADVCRAVHHAHQKGVIHRDLKPGNVLVGASPDGAVRPRVIDFGIARLLDDATPSFTRAGGLPGTPAYMSPEQLAGDPGAVDARTDIYSLGIILYELLCGFSPFPAHGPIPREPAAPAGPARKRSAGEIATLAGRRALRPGAWLRALRGDFASIALKCLETDPARRYPSADALALDLTAFAHHRPVSARRPGPLIRVGRFMRRHPVASFTALAVLLTLILAATAVIRSESRAIEERTRAENLFRGLSRLVLTADPEHGKPRDYTMREAILTYARDMPPEWLRDPLTEARARHMLGTALFGMGEAELALPHLERAHALANAKLPATDRASIAFNLAVAKRGTDPAEAARLFASCDPLLEKDPSLDSRKLRVRAIVGQAIIERDQGRYESARASARRAIALAENCQDPELTARCLWALARVEEVTGRPAEARALTQRRRELLEAACGPDHPETWDARGALAFFDLHGDHPAEALETLREVAAWSDRHFGPGHRQTLARRIDLARGLRDTGHRAEALVHYRETLSLAGPMTDDPTLRDGWQAELTELERSH